MNPNKVELISTDILNKHKELFGKLSALNKGLALSSGWHYILDWVWTTHEAGSIEDKTILDAGAGIGLLQWYFASQGAHVISVDRSDRTCIPFHLVKLFNVDGVTRTDNPLTFVETINIFNGKTTFQSRVKAIARGVIGFLKYAISATPSLGNVRLYRKDLGALTDIPDNSIDIVISISALEHNKTIDEVKNIVRELNRVLKPGGKMIVTLPASQKEDWFFDPAYSWCFTDTTIKEIFLLSENTSSNYNQYETILEEINTSSLLKSNLSWRYYLSSKSGMPLGKWNPQYIPVGVVKEK